MSTIRRNFLRFALGIAVLTSALYTLTFVDLNRFRAEIESAAGAAIGRPVTLGGDIRIGYSLRPTVVLRDLHLGNESWASDRDMLTAERGLVRVSLLPLLVGSVEVVGIDIERAQLNLQQQASGRNNWDSLLSSDGAEEDGEASDVSTLPRMRIDDLSLQFRDGEAVTRAQLSRVDVLPRGEGLSVGIRGDVEGQTLSVKAYLSGQDTHVRASDLELGFGSAEFAGWLEAKERPGRGVWQVDGELKADEVDLDAFGGAEGERADSLFSAAALPFDFLSLIDSELDIEVATLRTSGLTFTDLHSQIGLEGGELKSETYGAYAGDRFDLSLAAEAGTQTVDIRLRAPQFNIGQLVQELEASDQVDLIGQVALDVRGQGPSVQAIARSLDGDVEIVTGRGTIHSDLFELAAEDLIWALIPKGSDASRATVTCFLNHTRFRGGVGDVDALALVTEKIRTGGAGEINLRDETINLTVRPRPNDPGLLSLATPIHIKGPLTGPSIYPDTGAILGDVAVAVGAGLLTGGIGAILPLVSAQSFDADAANACAEVVASQSGRRSAPRETETPGTPNAVEKAVDGAGDVLEDIGDALPLPF